MKYGSLLFLSLIGMATRSAVAFVPVQGCISRNRWLLQSSDKADAEMQASNKQPVSAARPSLHPAAINAISNALQLRAKEEDIFRISEKVKPVDVAMKASQIASDAIAQRQAVSIEDGMAMTLPEEQTIAGRIIGVIMRLSDLEKELDDRVSKIEWVRNRDEWGTFGVLAAGTQGVNERVLRDPLFSVSRAESLLAVFLESVEIPGLKKAKQTVPDGSTIDFLDADRKSVLIPNV